MNNHAKNVSEENYQPNSVPHALRTAMSQPMRRDLPEGYRPFTAPKALRIINGESAVDKPMPADKESRAVSPVKNKVGSLFVPVRDIERSRRWYCQVLGLSEDDCEIVAGHLCPLPMEGTGIVLDTMPMWGGREPGGAPPIETPAFMLMTEDLQGSLDYMKKLGVELVTEIEHGHWFVVKDPDGNKLMICRE